MALSSLAGSPEFLSDVKISLFWSVPDLLRQREVYARRIVDSFCSIKDKNCFQPNDFENMWLLVRRMNSVAYLRGNFLFLIAISRSSSVTWPSPSRSSSSKNLLPVCMKSFIVSQLLSQVDLQSSNDATTRSNPHKVYHMKKIWLSCRSESLWSESLLYQKRKGLFEEIPFTYCRLTIRSTVVQSLSNYSIIRPLRNQSL